MPRSDPEAYAEYQRQYREQNREKLAEYDRERKKASALSPEEKEAKRARWRAWYYRHQEREQTRNRKHQLVYRVKLRLETLQAYSGPAPYCACCGEDVIQFLGLDHINNDGSAHRKEVGGGNIQMYLWARKNGYPPVFQVLCHNCNLAKGFYGQCPHQEEEVIEA